MIRSRIFRLLILALTCLVLVNGCVNHSRLPSEAEERLIHHYSGVIVLLRLRTVVDGKPSEEIKLWNKNERAGFGFSVDIGRLDPGQSPDLTVQRRDAELISPSAEARRQGWIYYVLPPVNYYIKVYDMEKKGSLNPGFMLTVSGKKRLVYAGTLDIACKKLLWIPPGQCSGVSLTDEGDAAKILAQAHFAQYGPISTSLMSKYDETVAASQRPAILPMGYVTTAGAKDLRSPEWVKRNIGRAAPPEATELAAGLLQVPGGGLFAAAYVAYLPVGLIAGAIAGKSAETKWQPCIQKLAQEIKEINPAAALQMRLDKELKKFRDSKTVALSPDGDPLQVAGQRGLKSLLQAEVQRIQIKECQKRGSFCIEVAIRARLWKIPEKSLYFDKILVYTNASPYERIRGEIQVPGSSPCRKMEVYCGPQSKQIFREEIANALPNLVDRLLIEVGF
jgi:hypothetical protein